MTVNEAKEKLKEAPEGTFLIRDSSHSDYLLIIPVKTLAGTTNLQIETHQTYVYHIVNPSPCA
jgi:suppressor of cytokine signaling 2